MNVLLKPIVVNDDWEVSERKGRGHPDTLADTLAEQLSIAYSKYTRNNFGVILHHNFDKVAILGGSSYVSFGNSTMTSPIRVVLNGRASKSFGGQAIPVRDLLEKTVYDFFCGRFSPFLEEKDIRIIYEVSTSSTPGAVEGFFGESPNPRHRWFDPSSLEDIPELKDLNCNDTSVACYTAPKTVLSRYLLDVEKIIHSSLINSDGRIGSDIKIMGVKQDMSVSVTIAIPLMAHRIKSICEFFETKNAIKEYLERDFNARHPGYIFNLTINPLDNKTTGDVYLTHCGSCIETGDEGVVGRGNRIGGLIRVNRAMSMEGICGKNPVYHTGKVLAGAAYEIMHNLTECSDEELAIYLVGQRGRSLVRPWFATVEGSPELLSTRKKEINDEIESTLSNLHKITEKFINREIPLC